MKESSNQNNNIKLILIPYILGVVIALLLNLIPINHHIGPVLGLILGIVAASFIGFPVIVIFSIIQKAIAIGYRHSGKIKLINYLSNSNKFLSSLVISLFLSCLIILLIRLVPVGQFVIYGLISKFNPFNTPYQSWTQVHYFLAMVYSLFGVLFLLLFLGFVIKVFPKINDYLDYKIQNSCTNLQKWKIIKTVFVFIEIVVLLAYLIMSIFGLSFILYKLFSQTALSNLHPLFWIFMVILVSPAFILIKRVLKLNKK